MRKTKDFFSKKTHFKEIAYFCQKKEYERYIS